MMGKLSNYTSDISMAMILEIEIDGSARGKGLF